MLGQRMHGSHCTHYSCSRKARDLAHFVFEGLVLYHAMGYGAVAIESFVEPLLSLVVIVASIWALGKAWRCVHRTGAVPDKERWLPGELRHATLAYSERRFVAHTPFVVGAVVDRGYRLRDGRLILVEFKTRHTNKAFMSDIVELSVQKIAIEHSSAGSVVDHGFVVVRNPETLEMIAIKVALLEETHVDQLRRRQSRVLRGDVTATKANDERICRECPFQGECRPRRA